MGGSKSKTVVDQKATQRRQVSSDAAARQKFIQNYNALFSDGDAPDTGFANSLSGYYGGASIGDIAKKLARTNTFTPKVKPTTYKVKTGGGLFSSGNILGGLLSGGATLAPDLVGSMTGGPTTSSITGMDGDLF